MSFGLLIRCFGCDFVAGRNRAHRSDIATPPLDFTRRLVSLETITFSLRMHFLTSLLTHQFFVGKEKCTFKFAVFHRV